jgi:hypothetical protein
MSADARRGATERHSPVVGRLDDAYLPLRGLAAYSGLSVRTLRGYLADSAVPLPHYRIGGKILVRRSDFDAWAARFRVQGTGAIDALVSSALEGL